jgi:hypothetical protein
VVELIRVVLLGGFRVDDNTIGLEQAKITPQLDSKKEGDSPLDHKIFAKIEWIESPRGL